MWPFKKKEKKTVVINSKYSIGTDVRFSYNNDSFIGTITNIWLDANKVTKYDVTVGGECPWVKTNLKENEITLYISAF